MKTPPKTKPASAKPAPKIKMEREIGRNSEHVAEVFLGELPERILRPLCKYHGVPVAKYKDDTAERLARHLVRDRKRKVIVIIK